MQTIKAVTPVRQQFHHQSNQPSSQMMPPQNYLRKVVSPQLNQSYTQQIRIVQSPEKQTIFNHNSSQSRIVMSPNLNISHTQIVNKQNGVQNVQYEVGSPYIQQNNEQFYQKENEKLKSMVASLQSEINQSKKTSIVDHSQDNQLLKDKISVLEQQLKNEKTSFEEFKNKIILVIDENEKLQKIYEQLNQDYGKLEKQNQELNEIIQEKDKKMQDQHSDLEVLVQENNRISESGIHQKASDLEQENEQLRNQITQLRQNTMHVDDQTSNYIQELENEIIHQKDEIKIQQNLIIDYERKINVLIDENEKLSQIIQSQNYEEEDQNYRFKFYNLKEQLEKALNNC